MTYPVLFIRLKAMMIDSIVLSVLFVTLVIMSAALEIVDPKLKAAFIFVPAVLFEPMLVWLTGGSIGHHFSGIRVVGKTSGKNLFILNGIVRYFVKTFLGFYSIAAMFITNRHQSVHDFLSHSVVVFKDETVAPPSHRLKSRETRSDLVNPSIGRRLLVILAYLVSVLFALSILVYILLSSGCVNSELCTETDISIAAFAVLGFIVLTLVMLILGFECKLPGALSYNTKNTANKNT